MVVVENVSAVKRKFSLCSRSKRGSKGEREVVNVDVIGLGSGKRASKGEGTRGSRGKKGKKKRKEEREKGKAMERKISFPRSKKTEARIIRIELECFHSSLVGR